MSPLFIPTMIGNIAAGNLSIRYGLRGECLNVVYEPVTGAHVGPGTVALFFYGKEK